MKYLFYISGMIGVVGGGFLPMFVDLGQFETLEADNVFLSGILFLLWAEVNEIQERLK